MNVRTFKRLTAPILMDKEYSPIHPANEFLSACLRSRWDPAALPAARAPTGEHDHRTLVEIAQAEGVASLLYSIARGKNFLPAPAEKSLRAAYYATARRNLLLFRDLEVVLHALAGGGIPAILLKGAALVQGVYGNPALRPMGDLDLLVRRADLPATLRALETQGYVPVRVELATAAAARYENQVHLAKPGSQKIPIEVHWSLLDSPYYQQKLAMDWFWQTARPLQVGNSPAWMLGPEGQILHLCAHLALHHSGTSGPRLLWLHDVAEVIAFYRGQVDWELLLSQAISSDLVQPLQLVLPRVAGQWNAPIPPAQLGRLQKLRPSPGEVRTFRRLTAPNRAVARRFQDDLASIPRWGERLRFAWINLFPAPAYMRQRYHISHGLLLPLYYPYRWFLGARSALRRTGQRKPAAGPGEAASQPGP